MSSEEGTNILGALFAGSPHVLIGANENIAWSHTVNRPDKTDVFALEMHPKFKKKYRVDDNYYDLEEYKASIFIKILGIPIKIKRKRPTLKTIRVIIQSDSFLFEIGNGARREWVKLKIYRIL